MTNRKVARNGGNPRPARPGPANTSLPRVLADRYELVRRVGTGGMADVYLARDSLLGRQVALKILHPQYASDDQFVERFRREARAAANLQHPNIVSIYDWGQQDNVHFMVMEYVEGRSLKDVISAEAPLSARRAASITYQVLLALEYAHRGGLVHRDVKPGNILLTASGDARVTDFGIARASDGDSMTQTGTILGTAYYLSPEQAQGLAVDGRSDLYSLGVVLYEMLTATKPFEGDSPVAIAYKHVRAELPRPSSVRSGIPAPLETVVMKILSKRPDDRYASAAEMRHDVQAFLEGRQVTTVLPERNETAEDTQVIRLDGPRRRPATRRPGWALALAVGLLVGGLALGVWSLVALLRPVIGGAVVPSIAGRSSVDADRMLRARGLAPSFQGNEPDESVPEGSVTRQRPEARNRVAGGSTVKFWVSSGRPIVVVPNLTDESLSAATKTLTQRGLVVGRTEDEFSDKPAGTVLRQNPRANSDVRKGTPIDLTVSKGAETAVVPDVLGREESDAVLMLGNANFVVDRYVGFSDQYPEGYIFFQDPPGGAAAPTRSTVKIYISRGPETFAMPDVTGQTEQEARDALQTRELVVETERTTAASPGQRGRVVSQDPSPGQAVRRGDRVRIVIGT